MSFQPSARRASAIARPINAPVLAAAAYTLPRSNLAQNSAAKKRIVEGLVFPLKAGNKPSKDG